MLGSVPRSARRYTDESPMPSSSATSLGFNNGVNAVLTAVALSSAPFLPCTLEGFEILTLEKADPVRGADNRKQPSIRPQSHAAC